VRDEYLLCLLLYDVNFHSLDAEEINASMILRFAFCCCVSVKLADIVYEVARFSRVSKPSPQKLVNFIVHLTSP